jgi:Flp pilus assembly protein TadD
VSDDRSASRGTRGGAGEESNALTDAFPLIAAGVLVIVGVVLFVTVLWPDSGTSERTPAAAGSADRNAPSTPGQADTPTPAPAEPPQVAASTEPPQVAAPPEAPAIAAMIDAAIAGDDTRLQSAIRQLAARAPARGDRARARELNAKALAYTRGARYTDAVPLFEAAHGADPGDAEVRENLGYALLKAGRIDEAEAALLSTLEVAPRRASAWGSLAFVYAKQDRKHAAVKLIQTAYRFAADRRKAAEAYRRQAKSDPDPKVRAMLTEAVARLDQVR